MNRKHLIAIILLTSFTQMDIYGQTEGISFSSVDTLVWIQNRVDVTVSGLDELGAPIDVVVVSIAHGAVFNPGNSVVSWTPPEPAIGQFVFSAESGSGNTYRSDFIVVAIGELYPDVFNEALRDSLKVNFRPDQVLGYDAARDSMYANLFLEDDGHVRGIYTGFGVLLTDGDPSVVMDQGGITAEHIWPQSAGASAEPQNSDLYHLAPVKSNIHSSRSESPFFVIADINVQNWYRFDEIIQSIPTENIEEYSRSAPGQWQPRTEVMGDVARAVDYFYVIHNEEADPLFSASQEGQIAAWSLVDPPTMVEFRRAVQIRDWQGNLNPFLLDPDLRVRLFGISEVLDFEDDLVTISKLNVEVFPNPSTGRFVVKYETRVPNETVEISVFDILGRRVFTERVGFVSGFLSEKEIELQGLSSGVYFINVLSPLESKSIPIIIVD